MPIDVPIINENFTISIDAGEKIELVLKRGVDNKKYPSMIQNYDDENIWVNSPSVQGQEVPIKIGEEIQVRMARRDSAYSYKGTITDKKVLRKTLPIIGITRPKVFSRTQLREFGRVPISFRLHFDIIEDHEELEEYKRHEGTTIDFSAGGIKFTTNIEVPRNSFLFIKILHPKLDSIGEVLTKAISCYPQGEGQYTIRVKFIGLSQQEVTDMIRLVWSHQIELRRLGMI